MHFRRRTVTRPLVRLYPVPETALIEVPLTGRGVKPGGRLVFAIDANDLVSRTEAELLNAVHAVAKFLRSVRGRVPDSQALEVYRLKHHPIWV